MPLFKCKIGDETGKVFKKEVEADSEEALKRKLTEEGYFVYEISTTGLPFPTPPGIFTGRKVRAAELLIFNQELAALLKAGLPLVSSLETLAEKEENSYFKELLTGIARKVKEGMPLSDAMESAPKVFSKLYVSSMRSGEKSGDLITNIRRYISYIKRVEELKKKVISASIYPLILLTVAIGVVIFLLLFVVPSFSQIFIDSGAALPMPTRILMSISNIIKNNIIVLILLLMLTALFFGLSKKSRKLERFKDHVKIASPWLGELTKKYAAAKFSRTLSTVLRSGSPLVQALKLSAGVLDNSFLEDKVISISKRVQEGETLAGAMEETELMPRTALKMIMVGEASGSLDDMFENVAELFEDEVDRKINFITTTIEPIMMLGMGLIIALIVVAMYLPIFKLAGAAG